MRYPKTRTNTKIVRKGALEFIEILSPKEANKCSIEKGWWNRHRGFPELLCLLHSEVSEALDAYRKLKPPYTLSNDKIVEELADVVIRLWDICGQYGIDISAAVLKKHFKNLRRPYRHGDKLA